jgi:anaerobic magnesium-protoporphyrin IX monomethyl ester cyclase
MTSAIASHGATLAPLMRRAGFRYVFLGIENVLDGDLEFLHASAKNTARDNGRSQGNATIRAIEWPHRNKLYVVGGLIIGNADDTAQSIEANLAFVRRYVDWPHIQHPTPYPHTPMTEHFRERGLIANEHVEHYDGTTAVVRSEHMAAEDIEYLRWKAERWIKLGPMPAALGRDPWFLMRHGAEMLAYTFGGCTLRGLLGLEDDRRDFGRYKAIKTGRARLRLTKGRWTAASAIS